LASWGIAIVSTSGTVSALAFFAATTVLFASNGQVVVFLLTLVGQAKINNLSLDEIVLVNRFL
jgi:peroxiredoxin family protein